jgi:DNA polymerase I-like protein with 3'-5' exonuclease and polymerase domains
MLDRQHPYPSLEETAKKYGLPSKLDIVKTEYWDKEIDTDAVPYNILSDYCIQDVDLTYALYLLQLKQFQERPQLYRLFKLACQDLLVLAEMEWNGLPFNETLCKERADECEKEKLQIVSVLSSVYPDVPINFGSGDQLSAFLYGGTVVQTVKQPAGVFKTGERKGQVKFQNVDIEHKLPRLVEPLKNSELKKPGFYATDEGTLKQLKGPFAKKYVALILRLARLDKLIGTYYEGLPKLNKTMDWTEGMLYPNYNQCVTQTGRLSSSRPNGQNLAGDIADIVESIYD